MVDRFIFNELIELVNFFPVTGIVGPRQVGKTTLSRLLAKGLNKPTRYLDLENPRDLARLTDPVLFFESNEDNCIILDEIQRMPELFPILRSMVDQNRTPARFIILGSASPELIRDSSESLAGRVAYKELTPFLNLEVVDSFKSMRTHWLRGGFPDSFLAPNDRLSFKWLHNFVSTYIERDLPLLGLDINRSTIRKLWTMVAHINASLLNLSNLAKSLGVTSTTIKKYLEFLEEAFLIRLLKPYATNVKKRLVKSPKIYIRDTGILHHLLTISSIEDLEYNPQLGNSWEGYVVEQVLQSLSNDFEGYFYRTHQGAECDLVITRAGKPVMGIEIKYTASPKLTRGMLQSFEDLKTKNNFVITPNTDDFLLRKDIRACSLQTFIGHYMSANKMMVKN